MNEWEQEELSPIARMKWEFFDSEGKATPLFYSLIALVILGLYLIIDMLSKEQDKPRKEPTPAIHIHTPPTQTPPDDKKPAKVHRQATQILDDIGGVTE